MLQRRTDLAVEAREMWGASAEAAGELRGVKTREGEREGFPVTRVDILDGEGARALGKPVGSYVTLELSGLQEREEGALARAARAVAAELTSLLGDLGPSDPVLVVGLGNRAITPDAIGPKAADLTLVTRHLVEAEPERFGLFRPVAALAAGVLGTTGVESGELVKAVAEKVRPARILAVDALASRSLKRVCRTVQLSDVGIVPGSGVGNHRYALDRETMGVPVIALGVPTVVDAATLCADVLAEAGRGDLDPQALGDAGRGVIVTPREIDSDVTDLAKVLGYGIDLALQPALRLEDIELLTG